MYYAWLCSLGYILLTVSYDSSILIVIAKRLDLCMQINLLNKYFYDDKFCGEFIHLSVKCSYAFQSIRNEKLVGIVLYGLDTHNCCCMNVSYWGSFLLMDGVHGIKKLSKQLLL